MKDRLTYMRFASTRFLPCSLYRSVGACAITCRRTVHTSPPRAQPLHPHPSLCSRSDLENTPTPRTRSRCATRTQFMRTTPYSSPHERSVQAHGMCRGSRTRSPQVARLAAQDLGLYLICRVRRAQFGHSQKNCTYRPWPGDEY